MVLCSDDSLPSCAHSLSCRAIACALYRGKVHGWSPTTEYVLFSICMHSYPIPTFLQPCVPNYKNEALSVSNAWRCLVLIVNQMLKTKFPVSKKQSNHSLGTLLFHVLLLCEGEGCDRRRETKSLDMAAGWSSSTFSQKKKRIRIVCYFIPATLDSCPRPRVPWLSYTNTT